MICPFCSQWSAEGTLKCPFCGNDRRGEADRTAAGPQQMGAQQLARIPRQDDDAKSDLRAMSRQFLGSGDDEPLPRVAVVLMVGGLVAVLLGLLIRC